MNNCLFSFLLLISLVGEAQNPEAMRTNIWYFGNGAGLDFSSGSPVAITDGALHSYEGGGSICDLEGNLLFYTDGDTVWNRMHQPMPNGTGLMGCGNYGSSAQNGLIIPKPGSESIFYIFTNDCSENICEAGLRYSVVDISLNFGTGDVSEKNILLMQPSTEALAATKHANGIDYWVVSHEYNSNRFFCYLLSEDGIASAAAISEIGMTINTHIVSISISHKGDKVAMAYQGSVLPIDQLFEFENSNGTLTNLINLFDSSYRAPSGTSYCCEFSPDDTKLYYMSSGSYIYQYCLSGPQDSISIGATASLIAFNPDNTTFAKLQNGLDEKIYISSLYSDSISVIHFPNQFGPSCFVSVRTLYLGGKKSEIALPSYASSFFYNSSLIPEDCETIQSDEDLLGGNEVLIFPNPSHGLIQIKMTHTTQGNMIISNAIGQLVFKGQFQGQKFSLDMSGLASGLYHLNLYTEDNNYFEKKIIIQKH